MIAYFTELAGPTFGPIVGWTAIVVLIAIILWILVVVLRKFRSGLFISGSGKGRLPRLAVTDAVPVDSHRRLVLVRRDDVEHLIMIGGPTDIVVEAGIGKAQAVMPQPRMPVQSTQPQAIPQAAPQSQQQPAPQQRPATIAAREALADAERGRPVRTPDPQFTERRPEPPVIPTAPANITPPSLGPAVPARQQPVAQPAAPAAPPLVQTPVAPPQIATAPSPQPRDSSQLDLDRLLNELRPNPQHDR